MRASALVRNKDKSYIIQSIISCRSQCSIIVSTVLSPHPPLQDRGGKHLARKTETVQALDNGSSGECRFECNLSDSGEALMRLLFAVSGVLLLAACSSTLPNGTVVYGADAEDHNRCTSQYGTGFGTPEYANCRMVLAETRSRDSSALLATGATLLQPAPRLSTTCTTFGNTMTCR